MGNSGGKGVPPPSHGNPKDLNEATAEIADMYTTSFDSDSAAKFLYSDEYDNNTDNYEMPNQSFTVGRATNNDLVISRYSSISRKQVQMAVEPGKCQMEVLGSAKTQLFANRTLSPLSSGDSISLKGSGLVRCGDELILGYVTSTKCEHLLVEIVDGVSYEGGNTLWTTGAKCAQFGVGRKAKNEITLPKNSISGNHLEFERITKGDLKGWWTVADVSSGGTRLCRRWKMVKRVKYLVVPGMTLSMGDNDEEITFLISALSMDGKGGPRTEPTDELPEDPTAVEAYDDDE